MAANEIAYVDPQMMLVDNSVVTIPVGTLAVVPHRDWDNENDEDFIVESENGDEHWDSRLPRYTILCVGQNLPRLSYPELSPKYPDGGFYDFYLPNLSKKFIVGINSETNEIEWGDGVVYYQSVPKAEPKGHPSL